MRVADYIAISPVVGGRRSKVYDGGAWASALPKVWGGSSWTTAAMKVWDGSNWIGP